MKKQSLSFSQLALFWAAFALSLFSSLHSLAQDETDPYHLKQTGKLFTVTITPGDKTTTFSLAGKKAMKIKLDDVQLEAELFPLDASEAAISNGSLSSQKLIVKRIKKDEFVYEGALKGQVLKVELKSKKAKKLEGFHFKIMP